MVGMEEMVAGGIWMIARSIFFIFSSFLSPPGIVFIFIDTIVPLLVRLTPPFFLSFFLEGTNGE